MRRLREAGALLFAKTNMHEIALGITGENPGRARCGTPWTPAARPGGLAAGAPWPWP